MKPRLSAIYLVFAAISNFPLYLDATDDAKNLNNQREVVWFFIGCLDNNELGINFDEVKGQQATTPYKCVQKCHQLGVEFACLSNASLCHCCTGWNSSAGHSSADRNNIPLLLRRLLLLHRDNSNEGDPYFGHSDENAENDAASKCFDRVFENENSKPVQVYYVSPWTVEKLQLQLQVHGNEEPIVVDEEVTFKVQLWLTRQDDRHDEQPHEKSTVKLDNLKFDEPEDKTFLAATSSEGKEPWTPLSFSCLFQISDGRARNTPPRTSAKNSNTAQSSRIAPVIASNRRRLYNEPRRNATTTTNTNRGSSSSSSPPLRGNGSFKTLIPADGEQLRYRNFTLSNEEKTSSGSKNLRLENFSVFVAECSWNHTFAEEGDYTIDACLWSRGAGELGRFGWKSSLAPRKVTVTRGLLSLGDILLTAEPPPLPPPSPSRNGTTPKCVPTLPEFQFASGVATTANPNDSELDSESSTTILLYTKTPYDLVARFPKATSRASKTLSYGTSGGELRIRWRLFNIDQEDSGKELLDKRATDVRDDEELRRINRETTSLRYVLETEGVFILQLNVSKAKQNLIKRFTLIAIDYRLENLRFSLSTNSTHRLKPNANADFVLSLKSTDLEHKYLLVNFGDGVTWNQTLKNVVEGHVLNRSSSVLEVNYESCTLLVKLRHRYRTEGVYNPGVTVFENGQPRLSESVGNVFVCETLEGATITGSHILPVGNSANTSFQLALNRDSKCPRTIQWFWRNASNVLDTNLDNIINWTLNFNHRNTGSYVIEANVDNVVSSTSALFNFNIVEPVSNVSLQFQPLGAGRTHIVKLWDTVRVTGLRRGTDTVCTWNVYNNQTVPVPEVLEELNNCTSTLTFDNTGNFTICLKVKNAYNYKEICQQLEVQQEVQVLELFTDVVKDKLQVYLTVNDPRNVNIEARLSDGQFQELLLKNSSVFTTNFQVPRTSSVNLTVSARNDVSQIHLNRTITIVGKTTVPNFVIKPTSCVIVGQPIVLQVTFLDGYDSVSKNDKQASYVYKWTVSGHARIVTSLPFYSLVPTIKDGGALNVRVTVVNQNGVEKRNRTNIKVDSSLTDQHFCVWNEPFTEQRTNFTINIHKPFGRNVTALLISLQNLTSGEILVEKWLPVTENRLERWRDVLYSRGVVLVGVGCFSEEGPRLNQSSLLLVGAGSGSRSPAITSGSLIRGPKRIPLSRVPTRETWEAVTSTTEGLIYKWRLDEQPEVLQASPKFSARFDSSGNHTLRLKVRDLLSGASAAWVTSTLEMSVAREFPIRLQLEYGRQSTEGDPSSVVKSKLNFTVKIDGGGGPPFSVYFKFGDGTSRKVGALPEEKEVLSSLDLSEGPRFVSKTYHHYRSHGLYHVAVNVSYPDANRRTRWICRNVRVLVPSQEPVGILAEYGLSFAVHSPSLVALFQNVVVVASSGFKEIKMPKIDWDFGDGTQGEFTKIENSGNISKATHSYGKWGNYTVRALIKIPGLRTRVIQVQPTIRVVEPIQRLKISSRQIAITPSENITLEVQFWRGSDVVFNVSFDDGSFVVEKPEINAFPVTMSLFTHQYLNVGVYRPSVLAINLLGTVKVYLMQELIVQLPPMDLKLQEHYVTKKNVSVEMEVKISSGTNVSYDWFLGDRFWMSTSGSKVNLNFPRTGMYRIAVEAYNYVTDQGADGRVNRPKVETRVYVLDILRNVRICLIKEDNSETCEGDVEELDLPLEEKLVFKSRVEPDSEKVLKVIWNLGNTVKNTASTMLQHKFKDPGRYSINVTVDNIVSKVTSGTFKIRLIQKLQNLTNIKHDGTVLRHEVAVFHALFWHGSDLEFLWDFGDGSVIENGTTSVSQHSFNETGEYFITVTAWNKFSRANFTTNIFVLDKPCPKPILEIIEQCRNQQLHLTDPLQVEIDLSVTCKCQLPVTFHWSIVDRDNDAVNLPERLLSKRNLYLSPGVLQPGVYKISIKVSLPDTIIYAEASTEVKVEPLPLIARIDGGLTRRVGRLDTVVFDASVSQLPDGIDTEIEFKWSCRALRVQIPSCFKRNFDLKSVQNFTIPVEEFSISSSSYIMSLTITNHEETSSTSTVIEIDNEESNLLKLEISGNVNNNEVSDSQMVKLEAKCIGCEDDLDYQWVVWLVEDGYHQLEPDVYDCTCTEGTAHNIIENVIQPSVYDKHDANMTSIDVLLPTFPNFTLFSELNTTRSKRDTRSKSSEKSSNGRKTTTYSMNNYPVEHIPYVLPKTPDYQFPPHLNVTDEGLPGEGGSARAREHTDIDKTVDKVGEGSGDKFHIDTRKEVRDETIDPDEPHILHRPRVQLSLYRNETTTGLNTKYLVIKKGVLKPSSTYIVSVNVRGQDSGKSGAAMSYFKVAPGPANGRCSVAPVEGIALETTFRLHCLEWKSEKRPLTYVIYFSLEINGPKYPLYSGFNPNAKFYLPSGVESRNYTLTLHLKIKDNFGTETRVCDIETRVIKPILRSNTYVTDEGFKKLTTERNVQGVLSYILIDSLNYPGQLVVKDGLKLLQRAVGLETSFEVAQYLTVLSNLVTSGKDLTAEELRMATELVFNSVSVLPKSQIKTVSHAVLMAIFKILNSSTELDDSTDWRLRETYVNTREQLLNLMDNLTDFNALLFVEDPVELSIPEIAVSYGYLSQEKLPFTMMVGPVKLFYLEVNDTTEVSTMMNKYFNLILFGYYSDSRFPVNQVLITNISVGSYGQVTSEFTAQFPRYLTKDNISILRHGFINVHNFNLTHELVNESLSVIVHLENELDNPLVVMLGLSNDIRPNSQLVSKTLTRSYGFVNLFIPAGLIKHDSQPHVIIAPVKYANGERESQSPESLKYRISIASQVCLSRVDDTWTNNDRACRVLESVTNESQVTCRCSTTYPIGLVTWSPTLQLTEEAIDDILGSYYNPTPLVLFALVILVYGIFLRKTYQLDQRNAQHCLLNELKENKSWEGYFYFVSVRTGPFLEAGTTASVYLVLHGDRGYSTAKCLSTPATFQRSSRDNFLFGAEKCLGKIWKVQVWHNNAGSSPSWYLQDLSVVDLINGDRYQFNCDKWLSVEEEDGLIERELLAEESNPPFSKMFRKTLSYVLPNHHLWSSVFSAPSWSVFNHSQRLTCCLSTIFTSSALCALGTDYLRIPNQEIVSGIPWQSLVVSVVSSIASFIFHSQLISATRHVRYRKPSLFGRCRAPLVDCIWCSWWWCWLRAKRTSQGGSGRSSSPSILMDELMDSDSEYQDGVSTETDSDRSDDFEEDIELSEFNRNHDRGVESSGMSLHLRFLNGGGRERVVTLSDISSQRSGQTSSGFEDWLPEANDDTSPVLEEDTISEKDDDRKRLPQCFLHLSWVFLILIIVIASFITFKCINRLNSIQVFLWLTSWCFAVMLDVAIWQPLMVLSISVITSVTAYCAKESCIVDYCSKALKLAMKKCKERQLYQESFCQPRSRGLTYNRPPSEYKLIQARQQAAKFRVASFFIKNSFCSVFIGALLLSLVICDPPSDYFELRRSITLFVQRSFMGGFKTFSQFKNWHILNMSAFMSEFPTNTNCEVAGQPQFELNLFKNVSTLEFLLFNPPTNLFSFVYINLNYPSLPSMQMDLDISIAWLKETDSSQLGYNVTEVLFICLIFWIIKLECWRVFKNQNSYWKNFSNVLKVLFCVTGCAYFGTLIYQSYMTESIFLSLKNGKFKNLVDVRPLAFCDWLRRSLRGTLLFTHILNCFDFLKFHPLLEKFVKAIAAIWKQLLCLMVIWCFFLFGIVIVQKLLLSDVETSNHVTSTVNIINSKRSKQRDHRYILTSLFYAITISITFLALGFVRAALVTSFQRAKTKRGEAPFSPKVAKKVIGNILRPKKLNTVSKIESNKLPLEFLLFQLDTMVNELIEKANKLFASKETKFETDVAEENMIRDGEMLDLTPRWNGLSYKTSSGHNVEKSSELPDDCQFSVFTRRPSVVAAENSSGELHSRVIFRVRKTYPIQMSNSLDRGSDSEESLAFDSNVHIRRTQSKGKGKNGIMQMTLENLTNSSAS